MRYSNEFKLECIEMYRQRMWQKTPDGIKASNFQSIIRNWSKIEEKYKELGYNGLVNKKKSRKSNKSDMSKKHLEPKPLAESEREEY